MLSNIVKSHKRIVAVQPKNLIQAAAARSFSTVSELIFLTADLEGELDW